MARSGEVTVNPRRTKVLAMRLDHRAWRALKSKHKEHSKIRCLPCWLHEYGMCVFDGAPIDYAAMPGSRRAYETDHVIPRSVRADLWLIWSNLRPSHCACNRARQDKPVDVKAVVPQHVWVRPTF